MDPFWKSVGDREDGQWHRGATSFDESLRILREAIPACDAWRVKEEQDKLALYYLLVSVSDGGKLPPYQFDLGRVTFLHDEAAFIEVLRRQPDRGITTWVWQMPDTTDFDITIVGRPSRIVQVVHKETWFPRDEDDETTPCYGTFYTLAVCETDGVGVTVYAAPEGWDQLVIQVRAEIRHAGAREKAAIDMPNELRRFVDLLGYNTVAAELARLQQ